MIDPNCSDNALIQNAIEGDKRAFELLFERYKTRIFNFVYRILGNAGYAEEVTHDTFIRVYQNLARYRPGESASAWIYCIAKNEARKYLRHERFRKVQVSIDETSADGQSPLADLLETRDANPHQKLRIKEFNDAIQRAIHLLPEKYRTVLILHDIEEISYEEIQIILRLPYQTVATRLARARQLFRRQVDPKRFEIQFFIFFERKAGLSMRRQAIPWKELSCYVDDELAAQGREKLQRAIGFSPEWQTAVTELEEAKILLRHAPKLQFSPALNKRIQWSIENLPPVGVSWFAPVLNGFDLASEFALTMPRLMLAFWLAALLGIGVAGYGIHTEQGRVLRIQKVEGNPVKLVNGGRIQLREGQELNQGKMILTQQHEAAVVRRENLFTLKVEEKTEATVERVSHFGIFGRNEIMLKEGTVLFQTEGALLHGQLSISTLWLSAANQGTIALISVAGRQNSIAVLKGSVIVKFSESSQKPLTVSELQEFIFTPGESIALPQPISQMWLEKLVEFSSEKLILLGLPSVNRAAALVDQNKITASFVFFNIPDSAKKKKLDEVRRLFEDVNNEASLRLARYILHELAGQYETENRLDLSAPILLFETAISAFIGDEITATANLERVKQNGRYSVETRALAQCALGIIHERQGKAMLAQKELEGVIHKLPGSKLAEEAKEQLKQLAEKS